MELPKKPFAGKWLMFHLLTLKYIIDVFLLNLIETFGNKDVFELNSRNLSPLKRIDSDLIIFP